MAVIQILLSVAVGLATTFGDNPWYREADQLIGIEVPPAEGGRPVICYFKQGVDGFSIRIAKILERFEGGLRKFAYRMHHKSRILRYGVDDGSTTQIWDPRARRKGQGFFGHLLEPFKIAILVVLSIQLDFLTSFLAEVHWLLFTIIYITTRLVKFRIPSPADDNKWTFGQVLPLILLVAPIAIAIKSFYTAPKTHTPQMTHTNTQQMNGPGSGLDPVAGLGHVDSLAYRGVFFLAALSYIEVGIYFVLDQPDTEGLALPLLQIALSMLLLQPLYQIYWVVCDVFLSKASWSRTLKLTTYDTLFLGSSAMQVSLNFCAKFIRWLPDEASEPTSTIVVTSPRLKRFVDLRILLPDNDPSWTGQDEPLPLSRLDWAIAGTTVSTKIPDPDGNLTSHSTFHQWISSRTLDSDAGFMYPQPNDLTLEKGSMVNPDTGIDTAYEELWHDATPTAVPGEPAVRALVLQTEDEKNGVRGSVVRLGCYAQGLIRVGENISLERWEWKEGWKRTIRMGDAELPIEKILGEETLKEGDTVDVGGREWKVIEESGKDGSKL
ncbi:hypothetical protein FOVSG1_005787 [Fusarium oxysporum f. sp. vasinfectum]